MLSRYVCTCMLVIDLGFFLDSAERFALIIFYYTVLILVIHVPKILICNAVLLMQVKKLFYGIKG